MYAVCYPKVACSEWFEVADEERRVQNVQQTWLLWPNLVEFARAFLARKER